MAKTLINQHAKNLCLNFHQKLSKINGVMEEQIMRFGEHLRQARLAKNLTQEQVAQEFAITRQTLSNWENEKSYPDIGSLIKLSDYYQITLDELLKEDSGMRENLEKREVVNNLKQIKKKLVIAVIGMLVVGLSAVLAKDDVSTIAMILFWISDLTLCSALMDVNSFDQSQSLGLEYGWQKFLTSNKGKYVEVILVIGLTIGLSLIIGQVRGVVMSVGLGTGFLVGAWLYRHHKY